MEIQAKYSGYIQRQGEQVEKAGRMESNEIPADFDYAAIRAMSHEGREKLTAIRPRSLGQAARIPGLRPGDVQILHIHIEQAKRRPNPPTPFPDSFAALTGNGERVGDWKGKS